MICRGAALVTLLKTKRGMFVPILCYTQVVAGGKEPSETRIKGGTIDVCQKIRDRQCE